MNYKENILETIGNTPLVKLNKIMKKYDLTFNLFAKVERFNPSGSVKDRASYYMIKEALKEGKINKDTLIIEPTSGNTGIGLAMVCSYLNLKLYIFMPESSSIERVKMMKALGAKVVLTKKELGMKGSIDEANKLAKETPNSYVPSQFDNKYNALAHYETTSIEILNALDNKLDVFIASFGTGGTLIGSARRFKEVNKNIEILGVEPESSPLLTKNKVGPHKIQGIGANFIPGLLDKTLVDKFVDVSDDDAYFFTNELALTEGIFSGISSGATLCAAVNLDKKKYKNKNIVIVLPDNGERYLSVEGLYE
ncbi:MAG: cysteine synthase A [Firmicutes bacterium]|uniref:Cysteine synthase n=1 Tax=Candidatus Onthovivens merdipullorum TaxID=2840889 RepID=A0A9D9DIG7_9BACL|nr:cysteine synthase A [Candidatus Onthovivens merdipullorum]